VQDVVAVLEIDQTRIQTERLALVEVRLVHSMVAAVVVVAQPKELELQQLRRMQPVQQVLL
jgi:hypothetical protein